MPSALRTTTVLAAAVPVLLLTGASAHSPHTPAVPLPTDWSALAPLERPPDNCHLGLGFVDYRATAHGLRDLDAAQAQLADEAMLFAGNDDAPTEHQGRTNIAVLMSITPSAGGRDSVGAREARALTAALRALSRPEAHRSTSTMGMELTAVNPQGQVVARAAYVRTEEPGTVPDRGYLFSDLSLTMHPPAGQPDCATSQN